MFNLQPGQIIVMSLLNRHYYTCSLNEDYYIALYAGATLARTCIPIWRHTITPIFLHTGIICKGPNVYI